MFGIKEIIKGTRLIGRSHFLTRNLDESQKFSFREAKEVREKISQEVEKIRIYLEGIGLPIGFKCRFVNFSTLEDLHFRNSIFSETISFGVRTLWFTFLSMKPLVESNSGQEISFEEFLGLYFFHEYSHYLQLKEKRLKGNPEYLERDADLTAGKLMKSYIKDSDNKKLKIYKHIFFLLGHKKDLFLPKGSKLRMIYNETLMKMKESGGGHGTQGDRAIFFEEGYTK